MWRGGSTTGILNLFQIEGKEKWLIPLLSVSVHFQFLLAALSGSCM